MTNTKSIRRHSINLNFEEINLPPFQDILLLTHKCGQGKVGVSKCMTY